MLLSVPVSPRHDIRVQFPQPLADRRSNDGDATEPAVITVSGVKCPLLRYAWRPDWYARGLRELGGGDRHSLRDYMCTSARPQGLRPRPNGRHVREAKQFARGIAFASEMSRHRGIKVASSHRDFRNGLDETMPVGDEGRLHACACEVAPLDDPDMLQRGEVLH
jgi:hypothetical protein